jgi:hypothetical protein
MIEKMTALVDEPPEKISGCEIFSAKKSNLYFGVFVAIDTSHEGEVLL